MLLMEPVAWRRRVLQAVAIAGLAVGLYLLYALAESPIGFCSTGHHVEYDSHHHLVVVTLALYIMSTTVRLLLPTHRGVRRSGILALVSAAPAYGAYATWFLSIW